MERIKNYDVLLIPSTSFFERFRFGRYKSAGFVVTVTAPGTGREIKSVMVKGRIVGELTEFRERNPGTEILRLPFKRTHEETMKAFYTVFGGKDNAFQGIARIFGLNDWEDADAYLLKRNAQ